MSVIDQFKSILGFESKPAPKKKPFFGNGQPIKVEYLSHPVTIPSDFLATDASHTASITSERVDFVAAGLPWYKNLYAIVLENVLTEAECNTLLSLAVQSTVPESQRSLSELELEAAGIDTWKPAMVNAGFGWEVAASDYRNSDRIVWDTDEIMERLWKRVCAADGLLDEIEMLEGKPDVQSEKSVERGDRWKARGLNKRARFLKYGPGQFFRQHCDGLFDDPVNKERSFYTLHLYLNGPKSNAELKPQEESLVGGATTFWSRDETVSFDVSPKIGRVLIFQQMRLLHSGQEVHKGVKYTMRSDVMFDKLPVLENDAEA